MKILDTLSVQIQPDLLENFSEQVVKELRSCLSKAPEVEMSEVQRGEDDGRYIDVNFSTPLPMKLWKLVRAEIFRLGLQRASIVVCTKNGKWDDYLLLYHFDKSQKLD